MFLEIHFDFEQGRFRRLPNRQGFFRAHQPRHAGIMVWIYIHIFQTGLKMCYKDFTKQNTYEERYLALMCEKWIFQFSEVIFMICKLALWTIIL